MPEDRALHTGKHFHVSAALSLALIVLIAIGAGVFTGCTKTNAPKKGDNIMIAEIDCHSPFTLVTDTYASFDTVSDAEAFAAAVENKLHAKIKRVPSDKPEKFGNYI